MTQLRHHSLLESCLNTASGFLVSYLAWPIVCRWVLHVPFHAAQDLGVVGFFTLLSVARNYLWRRAFNRRRSLTTDEAVWLCAHHARERAEGRKRTQFGELVVTPAEALHLREMLLTKPCRSRFNNRTHFGGPFGDLIPTSRLCQCAKPAPSSWGTPITCDYCGRPLRGSDSGGL